MRYTSATHTALIFTCIPVFAAVFGYIFLEEVLQYIEIFHNARRNV
jgi:drug/metabolite transporter (DMT)-like permease